MKYIIELPEEVKEEFDNATKDDIYGSYYDYNSVIGNAIKNSILLEEQRTEMIINIKQYLKETNSVLLSEQAYKYLTEKASVIETLENQLIHCKDCEFYNQLDYSDNGKCTLFGFDTMFGFNPTPNWFCGSAEVKENKE